MYKKNKEKIKTFEYNIIKALLEANFNENKTTKDEIIIVCGSFFLMKEVRETLGYKDEIDPFELNEMSTNLIFGK